ncbi:MAG: hypothetical protein ABEI52_01660, partial [Halobacteriaceae archaeon]
HAVTANRAVDALVEDEMARAEEPFILREPNVTDVFNDSQSELHDRLGISDQVTLNVTLSDDSGVIYSSGPKPPDSNSVTTAWRVVSYQGSQAEVAVRVW